MIDFEKYFDDLYKSNAPDADSKLLLNEVKKFEFIIIWGIGNLGSEILSKLRENGVRIAEIWDKRFDEIKEIDGIAVNKPFNDGFDKTRTLVILCIANVASSPTLYHELHDNGWKNTLRGIDLYEAIFCEVPYEEKLHADICTRNELCTLCNCRRLNKIMEQQYKGDHNKFFAVDRVHFIINNFCNLRCSYCNRYMNTYPIEMRKNLDFETISYDIRRVMESIDEVGVGIVFGGEPFLHPDIDKIVGELIKCENLGAVLINSNGLAQMNLNNMNNISSKKVRLAFSNYEAALDDTQIERFRNNVKRIREKDIFVQVQNTTPTWVEFPTLNNGNISDDECREKRKQCDFPYLFVYDHKVFPCTLAMTLYDLKIADYTGDYVDILKFDNRDELHDAIKELKNKMFLETCRHCNDGGASVNAASQGPLEKFMLHH